MKKFLATNARTYLLALGINNEFEIAKILVAFEKSIQEQGPDLTSIPSAWTIWLKKIQSSQKTDLPFNTLNKEWKLTSMVPRNLDFPPIAKNPKLSGTVKPFFFILSALFWSIIYYFLIFKLL
ncbi:hypothetical protein [Leptospira ilyithenensis]|uniref:Uncharacterized protein n=1 Tax=Leptospira ilyithenensis TaxID=2484901 RepID=A0A4R9LWG5_9LEPT|nr:hypothetical protein [Leptospira ilyithenensis]TGN13714.1 hypothetical protein EHS11_03570 [Leptospira ilyithenensis]